MKNLIDTSQISFVYLSGKGGKEKEIVKILSPAMGWTRVSAKLYDFVHYSGLKVELKKQANVQWIDPSKYFNLTQEEKQIKMLFLIHKNGKVQTLYSVDTGTFLKRIGWSENFCKESFEYVCKYQEKAIQIKCQVKTKEFLKNHRDVIEIIYENGKENV